LSDAPELDYHQNTSMYIYRYKTGMMVVTKFDTCVIITDEVIVRYS